MPTILVDGEAHEVAEGTNLLEGCLRAGIAVPYHCWHPALGSVGACRQCAVKVFSEDGRARIVMACMTEATDGARISVTDPDAAAFRKAVAEWLMLNHPHDCPVCDEGGECHLQDMTVLAGHVYRQSHFPKRTHRNQDLGPFIHHEMNRCIQCYRCVRFYVDYAGGEDLSAQACHDHVYFGRQTDGPLESPFSGNLAEVCPTGVFTDKTLHQHYTRKWDLTTAPSVCVHCSVGCNTSPGARYGQVRRIRNRHNSAVNGWFLCDRGRFGYGFLHHPDRIRAPRQDGRQADPDDAADLLQHVAKQGAIGIGSPRASLEANFALRQLVGPDRFYAGVSAQDLALLQTVLRLYRSIPAASVEDAENADAVLILGEDVWNTAPRLALALRQAATRAPRDEAAARLKIRSWHDQALRNAIGDRTGPFCVVGPAPTPLDTLGTPVRVDPAGVVAFARAIAAGTEPFGQSLRDAERPVIVTGLTLGSQALLEAAAAVAAAVNGRLAVVVPECNSLGLALLADKALDTSLTGPAIVLENDLFRRLPPGDLEPWLERLSHLVVLDVLETRTTARATLVLPTGSFAESSGTLVNYEGRAQRFFRVLPEDGVIRDPWRWLRPDLPDLDAVIDALVTELPALRPVTRAAPSAAYRRVGERVPRQPHRYSGRTAIVADQTMHEPKPPADPDGPLAFSMEGTALPPPTSLRAFAWAPGFHSENALNVLPTGPAGARLVEPIADLQPTAPDPEPMRPDEVLVLEAHLVLGSEPLSAASPWMAARVPAEPWLEMSPEDAPGPEARLHIGHVSLRLPVRTVPGLLPGVVRLPRALPALGALHGLPLPAWGRVEPP